jgi:hypothetical protein
VDLRQLEILQAIAETGSFTACGKKLHVSQSAISRQILLLEEELGEPLFLRVGRQVRMSRRRKVWSNSVSGCFSMSAKPSAASPIGPANCAGRSGCRAA